MDGFVGRAIRLIWVLKARCHSFDFIATARGRHEQAARGARREQGGELPTERRRALPERVRTQRAPEPHGCGRRRYIVVNRTVMKARFFMRDCARVGG